MPINFFSQIFANPSAASKNGESPMTYNDGNRVLQDLKQLEQAIPAAGLAATGATVGATSQAQEFTFGATHGGSQLQTLTEVNALITAATGGAKVYRALLSQDGTPGHAPTVVSTGAGGANTPFENSIGNIVWTYGSAGAYVGTLAGAFPQQKTFFPQQTVLDVLNQIAVTITYIDDDSISVQAGTYTGLTFNIADGNLFFTSIEIVVYP